MSVEPWRKRGFVPDSDEEEDFDSLNANKENVEDAGEDVDLTYISLPPSTPKPETKDTSEQKHQDGKDGSTTPLSGKEIQNNAEQDDKDSRKSTTRSAARRHLSRTPHREAGADSNGATSHAATPLAKRTPIPRRPVRKPGKASSVTKENQDKDIWDIPTSPATSPARRTSSSRKLRSHVSTPKDTPSVKTLQTRDIGPDETPSTSIQNDRVPSRDSSPDELMVLVPSPPKPIASINKNISQEPRKYTSSDDGSSLSSAKSNLSAPSPGPSDGGMDVAKEAREQDILARILPDFDIPDDFLLQSSQQQLPREEVIQQVPQDEIQPPAFQQEAGPQRTRSLRAHKPEQMNPYTFESAKYIRLMREAGIRPVRPHVEAPRPQPAEVTDESQEQNAFDPNEVRSSPPTEEYLPTSRPERRNEKATTGPNDQNHDHHPFPIRRKQSTKRRKRSRSGTWHDGTHLVSNINNNRPQVIVDSTPPTRLLDPSIFNFPSSPPQSSSVSSASRTPRASEGFRFPAGFTPPPTTTAAIDSNNVTPDVDEPTVNVDPESAASSDEEVNSDSSIDKPETAEEREIRKIQRQTRGVLPASWVRIEAQQRLQQQKASQASRHASQRADAKGVARKLLRRSGQPVRPSQMDFGDDDESDGDSQSTRTPQPAEETAEETVARIVGFENPFGEAQEEDIFEDNRVDYMFPPTSRNAGHREKKSSLKRAHPKESASAKERRLKKARLKRQTRLTDSSYGTRRTKGSSTKSAPRLGVLDAPDVVSQPRKEQPQFLRIAARGARSRRDGGRQSPTRKFLQLGSKIDTTDANKSLREWKRGAIPQTKIQRPRSKPRKSQSLASLPTNRQRNTTLSSRNARLTSQFPIVDSGNSLDLDNQSMHEQFPGGSGSTPAEASNRNSATTRSTHAEQRGHQWIVQRNTAVTSLQRNNPRPAAGMTEFRAGQPASRAIFRQTLTLLNRDYRHQNSSRTFKPSLTLDRYISDTGPAEPSARVPPQDNSIATPEGRKTPQVSGPQPTEPSKSRRRLKKHPPNRVNLTLDEFVQDPELTAPISDEVEVLASTTPEPIRPSTFNVGGGMFNWQRSYSLDFGVSPLQDGTFFHESTFIGSREFSQSLQVLKRDLDRDTGFSSIPFKDQTFQWGVWNDNVSSQMGTVFDMIVEHIESCSAPIPEMVSSSSLASALLTFRSLISYVTEKLSFTDPIDRAGFLSRSMTLVFKLRDSIVAVLAGNNVKDKELARITCYNMVFANQIRQIATHSLVSPSLGEEALDLVKLCAKDAIGSVLTEAGRTEIRRLLEENGDSQQREKGIRGEFPGTEVCVIIEHLLRNSQVFAGVFRDLELEAYVKGIVRNKKDVGSLETAWRSLFLHLPFHEFDNQGIIRRDIRFKAGHDNWNLVKKLLSSTFESQEIHSATQTISYNAYCRTLFQRCHRLINSWGWRDCKPILDTLYDFFAQKTLYNLKLEESRGSPSFLDELDQNPSLEIRAGEPTFHTLLKIIASGLRFLSQRYDNKKIRNFAWRLLPNHGRMYPKDEPLRHEDLDALRNHHDLLCTLYWVVPNGYRPRLETIKDLVNPATSHRETCSINLRSWTRLVRFKLSTDEEISGLEPFADWHNYFVNELRKQHLLARNEIEAQRKDGEWISEQLIESTISQNQRQIESLLSMALGGMRTAVERAPSLEHAHRLISKTPFESLLSLFNPKVSRVNVVVSEALAVIVAYTRKDGAASLAIADSSTPVAVPPPEDDSQEYGDWDDIDAVMVQQTILSEGIEHVQYVLHPVVSRLVSNCFGEDHCPDDAVLLSVVDCWTSVAQVLVRHGLKRWDDYLDPFGGESWARLRETIQTRKFSPLFLAVCIEKNAQILSDCRMLVMSMWISLLAERSSLLKFQHRLTEVLLNSIPKDPLLQNLPFSKDKKLDRYKLTIEELTQRRLSLISSILSNMREHVLHLEISGNRNLSVTKREYSESLEQLMTAMKKNYRELGNGAVESAQGAYVDFVHRIIRFLQELTSDIRPVDPFFTDSALFPLPSTDPRYIVAKLKRYEPKLSSKKDLQTLIMFVQSIAERAVLEGQQDHLTEQLHTAMVDTYEAGDPDKPTLRAVLLRCISPGYFELAFSTPAAWLLCRPFIRSITLVFKDLLFALDTTDRNCVSSVLGIFDAVFHSVYRALRPLFNPPAKFQDTAILAMLAALTELVSSSLVVVDYIDRMTDRADQIVSFIQWFRDFALTVLSHLADTDPISALDTTITAEPALERPSNTSSSLPTHLIAARSIAFEEHQSCLKNWSSHGGKYYYIRTGHDSKEVILEPHLAYLLENEAEARRSFSDAVEEFTDRIDQLGLLPEE